MVGLLFLDGAGDFQFGEGTGLAHLVGLALLDQRDVALDTGLAFADVEQVDIVPGRGEGVFEAGLAFDFKRVDLVAKGFEFLAPLGPFAGIEEFDLAVEGHVLQLVFRRAL